LGPKRDALELAVYRRSYNIAGGNVSVTVYWRISVELLVQKPRRRANGANPIGGFAGVDSYYDVYTLLDAAA
jgi:hypothetical protein